MKKIVTNILLASIIVFSIGCQTIKSYHVENIPTQGNLKITVLPFHDARSYRDKENPVDAGKINSDAAIEILKTKENVQLVNAPIGSSPRSVAALTEAGKKVGADYVLCGQVFHFIKGRYLKATKAGLALYAVNTKTGQVVWYADDEKNQKLGTKTPEEILSFNLEGMINNFLEGTKSFGVNDNRPKMLIIPFADAVREEGEENTPGGGTLAPMIIGLEMQKAKIANCIFSKNTSLKSDKVISFDEAKRIGNQEKADFIMLGKIHRWHRSKQSFTALTSLIHSSVTAAQIIGSDPGVVEMDVVIINAKNGEVVWAGDYESKIKFKARLEDLVRRSTKSFFESISKNRALTNPRDVKDYSRIINELRK